MKARITSFLCFAVILLSAMRLDAQTPTQVIIANGGVFGATNKVTVASWDITTGNYTVFDSFPGGSVQHVFIWGNDAYVSADSTLMKYDLSTFTRTAEARIYGIRQTAVYLDKVIVTKGYGTLQNTPYTEVRFAANLGVTFTVPGIVDQCEGVVVVGDTAYIANPGSYVRQSGDFAVLDIPGQSLERVMNMDTMGKLIQDVYQHNDKIYTVNINRFNSPAWGYISEYDIPTATFTHHRTNLPVAYSAGIANGLLFADFGGNVGSFDLSTGTIVDPSIIPGTFAMMTVDSVNDVFYGTRTDYFSYGKIYKYSLAGTLLDSADIGISPEAMAVDYNVTVSNTPKVALDNSLKTFPQPFGNRLNVDLRHLNAPAQSLAIYDLNGRKLLTETVSNNGVMPVATDALPAGAYILQVQTRKGFATTKVIKTQD
jgi:Secretion system C-terminal sorting domain